MASITADEARIRVALQNPNLSGDEVRREADNLIAKLDGIEAADNLKAAIAAQQAEQDREQAAEAQQRADAVNHNRGMVAKLHPGWTAADIDTEAQKWAAEDASAIAALNVREAIEAGGYDRS